MLKICIFEGFRIEQPFWPDQQESNYSDTQIPSHLKSALETGIKPQVEKNTSDLDFDDQEDENIFDDKELIFV